MPEAESQDRESQKTKAVELMREALRKRGVSLGDEDVEKVLRDYESTSPASIGHFRELSVVRFGEVVD